MALERINSDAETLKREMSLRQLVREKFKPTESISSIFTLINVDMPPGYVVEFDTRHHGSLGFLAVEKQNSFGPTTYRPLWALNGSGINLRLHSSFHSQRDEMHLKIDKSDISIPAIVFQSRMADWEPVFGVHDHNLRRIYTYQPIDEQIENW